MKGSVQWNAKSAFYVNLYRAVIGPSATLMGRWRPDVDLRRMLAGCCTVMGWILLPTGFEPRPRDPKLEALTTWSPRLLISKAWSNDVSLQVWWKTTNLLKRYYKHKKLSVQNLFMLRFYTPVSPTGLGREWPQKIFHNHISTKECCRPSRGQTRNLLITCWTHIQLSHQGLLFRQKAINLTSPLLGNITISLLQIRHFFNWLIYFLSLHENICCGTHLKSM